ncbi:unnamed protein product [Miscanthus lutarioriparius]|uniref:Uncharacterized protein n=1 Tax=Miscanthus lutarioriparius TaxID=422564 RepID=A0A811QF38_9POAL|nr:unnamed protein product [Miscanthus lutarioriparius]
MESTDAAEFPLSGEKASEVMVAALDLVQLCEYIKDELGPLQGRIREMFHRIVHTRTEILDGLNLKNRLQVTDTVHRPIGMETLVNRGMSTGGNSPVTVTKLLDQGHSMDISAAPSQQQRLMTSAPGQAAPQARQLPRPSILSAWRTDRAAWASIPRPRRDPNRLPERGPQARVPTKHPLSVAEGPQDSSTEGMSDASQGTLEAPVSSSLGAMGSLLKKLSLLLAPNYPLRRSLKHAIKLLEEDLEEIRDALMEQSMVDYNKNKVKYWMEEGSPVDENTGSGDSECGNLIWVIGTPVDGGGASGLEPCAAEDDPGTNGCGATADSADAAATSKITGAEAAGRAGTPPNPDTPNCGNAGRPSIADSRAPWSARWWLTAVIWSWRPATACVSAWSASTVDMGWDAAGTVAIRVPDVATSGINPADCGPAAAGTPGVGTTEEGGTVADESPDVTMVSDTRLL